MGGRRGKVWEVCGEWQAEGCGRQRGQGVGGTHRVAGRGVGAVRRAGGKGMREAGNNVWELLGGPEASY